MRHRLSLQDRGGHGKARGLARGRAPLPARHPHADARRAGRGAAAASAANGAAACIHKAMDAANRRRPRRRLPTRPAATAPRHAAMRGAWHRDQGRPRLRRRHRKGPHRLRQSSCSPAASWSRLFCGNLDLRLPQLKVMSSVMRTEKFDGGPETSASGFGFGVRKRLDGGYNVASWSGNVHDIVPDTFRFFSDFMPIAENAMGNSACASAASSSRTGRSRGAGHSTRHHRSSACAHWIRNRISRSSTRRAPT